MTIYSELVKSIYNALDDSEKQQIKENTEFTFESDAYLNPNIRKVPIVSSLTNKVNCSLLLMAMVNAKMNMVEIEKMHPEDILLRDEYYKAFERGNGLFDELDCNCTIGIKENQEQLKTLLNTLVIEDADLEELKALFN